jgi:hypothetical protein
MVVIAGVEHGLGDGNASRKVIDAVHILEHRPEQRDIVDVPPRKVNGGAEGVAIATTQIIQDSDIMPVGD